jgi:hypothetical protein
LLLGPGEKNNTIFSSHFIPNEDGTGMTGTFVGIPNPIRDVKAGMPCLYNYGSGFSF